jgi:DNA-binding NtrC family response regulator
MNRQLLIVDDDEVIRLLLESHFRQRGFTCQVASGGNEALEILSRGQTQVLITDLDMPGMDGIALLRAVRKQGLFTRCVVVTGYATISNLTSCLREGAVGLVPKPLTTYAVLDDVVDLAFTQMQRWTDQMSAIVRLRPTSHSAMYSDPLSALEPKEKHLG